MQLDKDFTWQFDNFEVTNIPYFNATSRRPNAMPDVELKTVPLIRNHGSIVLDKRYTKKIIEVFGYIIAPNRATYESTIDELKFRLSGSQRPLVLLQAGTPRVYTASLTALGEGFIEGGKSFLQFTFECNQPFGQDGSNTVYQSPNFTTAAFAIPHIFQGFVDAKPIITAKIVGLTNGNNKTITIGNSITGQQISVTRNWVAGDELVINLENQKVFVNGQKVNYTGFFPTFKPYTAYAAYADNFATRTANVRIEYPKRYL